MKVNKLNMSMTIHDKAIRLAEGGIVEIDSNWFRLIRYPEYYEGDPCFECDLDSICRMDHTDICAECECILRRKCRLELASKGRAPARPIVF